MPAASPPLLCRGGIDGLENDARFVVKDMAGQPLAAHEWGDGQTLDHAAALHFVITWLEANLADAKVVAAGHRIVLGGARFEGPALIDGEVLDYLASLVAMEPFAPAVQSRRRPGVRRRLPGPAAGRPSSTPRSIAPCPMWPRPTPCPRLCGTPGVRHWGYHGISYDYISCQVPRFAPTARRVIVAHLGGGASLCAMLDSRVSVWVIPTNDELMIARHTLALVRRADGGSGCGDRQNKRTTFPRRPGKPPGSTGVGVPVVLATPTRRTRTMLFNTKTYLPAASMLDRQVEGADACAWRG